MRRAIIVLHATLLMLFITILFSCKKDKKESKEIKIIKDNEVTIIHTEEADNASKTENVFGEFKKLYSELLGFKTNNDFKKHGFSLEGSYNKWLKKVENLKKSPDSKLLLQKGVLVDDLIMLGMEYVNSKGQETEVTTAFNEIFGNAINKK